MTHSQDAPSFHPYILLVEDAVDLASVIVRELQSTGYRVVHVVNGERALEVASESGAKFDLVILDWMLPYMDGLDVLHRLREASDVPVLMLTARDAEIDRVLGLEMGADDYLTKPFSMRELIARTRAMLRRRALIEQTLRADQQTHMAIEVGDLRLDPELHAIYVAGEAVDLTRTEFALLYLLVGNAGRVFSRAYLLDTIWKEQYVDGDRSVDNAVLRLRKKLKGMGDFIETVWGIGYRWKRA
jgi:DNA-binding response OmpR family regulator